MTYWEFRSRSQRTQVDFLDFKDGAVGGFKEPRRRVQLEVSRGAIRGI